jgi:hypothetical protein
MSAKNVVLHQRAIIIPGLGDETYFIKLITYHWRGSGIFPYVYSVGWQNNKDFRPKLMQLIACIDRFIAQGEKVSLIGTSAGASAALNAFALRKKSIHKMINICGRLRVGPRTGFRSFQSKTAGSSSFAQSVQLAQKNEKKLDLDDRKKIMTIRPWLCDELVPSETVPINHARNIILPIPEHVLCIGAALTVFSNKLIAFLNTES